ncbi:hypothetical protein FOPE_04836 [Fonsecaea pedrosoi]|nr:hypothetical protein FOPE_04836 [Fonsecaea pedrosoi]
MPLVRVDEVVVVAEPTFFRGSVVCAPVAHDEAQTHDGPAVLVLAVQDAVAERLQLDALELDLFLLAHTNARARTGTRTRTCGGHEPSDVAKTCVCACDAQLRRHGDTTHGALGEETQDAGDVADVRETDVLVEGAYGPINVLGRVEAVPGPDAAVEEQAVEDPADLDVRGCQNLPGQRVVRFLAVPLRHAEVVQCVVHPELGREVQLHPRLGQRSGDLVAQSRA